jgi:hypothetical protein
MHSSFLRKTAALSLAALVFLSPLASSGSIGVGVGIGKIQLDKPLRAGGIYSLPDLPVIDTGDESGDYLAEVQYLENIPEIRPAQEWFNFSPATFSLKPGEVQQVKVTLTIPLKTKPGDYFAYLEARPVAKHIQGQTSIGVAAAAKLYFTVEPSNLFQGLYYRFISLYGRYHPWDTIGLSVLAFLMLTRFIGKRFKFEIAKK